MQGYIIIIVIERRIKRASNAVLSLGAGCMTGIPTRWTQAMRMLVRLVLSTALAAVVSVACWKNSAGASPSYSLQTIDGITYCFDSNGELVTGWVSADDGIRYFDPDSGGMIVGGVHSVRGLAAPVAVSSSASFADVGDGTAHADDIAWMLLNGISTGWMESDGSRTYRPFDTVVRADMAAFLYRLAGSPAFEPSYADTFVFSDVTWSTPHAREIWWLASTGITTGWVEADGTCTFRPGSTVVRADMAAFLFRLAGSPSFEQGEDDAERFADVTAETPHVREVWWLAYAGISTGWEEEDGSVTFRPASEVARADMAAFLHRIVATGAYLPSAEHRYLFDDNGILQIGWSEYGGSTYYSSPSTGALYAGGFFEVDGVTYSFDDDGALVKGWAVSNGNVFYFDPQTGEMATGGPIAICGLAAPIAAASGSSFADVWDSTPHAEDINWMLWSGVSAGWVASNGSRTYRPEATVVRADMAAFLYRLAGSPVFEPSDQDLTRFSDVDASTPHAREIWWLASSGISTGYGDGTFRPYATVVRQDMAAFLYRLAGSPDIDTSDQETRFYDVSGSTPHAREIWWLAATGISTGYSDGSFQGMGTVVRQDMAAFLHRMISTGAFVPTAEHQYLFSDAGILLTGWEEVDGYVRFFDRATGVMLTGGFRNADGDTYCFADDGTLITGWVTKNGENYFFDRDSGKMYKNGSFLVDGSLYRFSASGVATLATDAIARGIDVSEWQGEIDWEKVKADGIDFAILRVGYSTFKDASFEYNASECERVGMPYGVYVYSYAKNAEQAKKEADAVIGFLDGHTLAYPVYIDIEDGSQSGLTPNDFTAIATAFCTRIQEAGYEPGVYSMLSWWNTFFTSPVFNSWSKWIAQIYSECEYSGSYRFWQYSWSGHVDGIPTDVDMNYEYEEVIVDFTSAETGRVLDDGTYEIAVALSPVLVLRVADGSIADRANVCLSIDQNYESQRWTFTWDNDMNSYMIANVNSGSVMDLAGSKATEGANIQQYHSVGISSDQRWVITKTASGYMIASAVNPAYYLTLDVATPEDGANVQLGTASSATSFEIRLV